MVRAMTTPPPGIYEGVPDAEYRAWDAMNQSGLKAVQKSAAHYRAFLKDDSDTEAKLFGRALHAAVLRPDIFDERFVVRPTFSGKGMKARKEAWEAEHVGQEILSQANDIDIRAMREELKRHEFTERLFGKGKSEVSIRWDDPDYGVPCKARLDHLVAKMVGDIKTCQDAREHAFRRDIWKFDYYFQPAFTLDGLFTLMGTECSPFVFVAIEKKPPYGIIVWEIPWHSPDIEYGRERYKPLLQLYKDCCESGEWPSYPPIVQTMYLRRAV